MEEADATPSAESTALARAYYDAIDAGEYDRFADLLAPDVVHDRPDRTVRGRETLVGFMRDDRPRKDTSHEVRDVSPVDTGRDSADTAVAARGRLLDAGGEELFAFTDTFAVEDGRIARIRTEVRSE